MSFLYLMLSGILYLPLQWNSLVLCWSDLIIHNTKHYCVYVLTYLHFYYIHLEQGGECMYLCGCVHTTALELRLEGNVWGSVTPIYCVGPRAGTQDVRLGEKQLHLVSHLTSLCTFLFSIHALLTLKCLHLLTQFSVR